LLGIALFLPLGLYLFNTVSLDLLVRGTGLAIFSMVLLNLHNRHLRVSDQPSGGSTFLTGAICGFLGGAVNIAGPPVAAYALKQRWSPERFKAFLTQCLIVTSIYKVMGLLVTGNLTREAVLYAAWVTPFSVLGIGLGVIASRHLARERFEHLVALALIGVACMLMYRGSPAREESPASKTEVQRPVPPMQPAQPWPPV
jgi:uncharacterized membrane protein YfcA